MGRFVDIEALASEALALVETQEKTASIDEPEDVLKTDIGKALKQAAEYIRSHGDMEVTAADLEVLQGSAPTTKVASLSPLPVKNPSEAGDHFRKMASRVREAGDTAAEGRIVKAAQMLNAAVALKHLTPAAPPSRSN